MRYRKARIATLNPRYRSEIIEETNYYPFGLAHSGYDEKNNTIGKNYKYKYNGKELQEELGLNLYDYGARNYDAAIGRWMNVDPLAEKYPTWNSYHYVHNNPINLIDPTGMEADYDDDGWIVNPKTGEAKFSESYDGTNTPEGWYYGTAIIGDKTIYNADGTHQPIDSGSENCVSCHHEFIFGKDDTMSKLNGGVFNGLSFSTEGGKSSPWDPPKGSRTTPWVDMTVLKTFAMDVFGPQTVLPGVAPDGSNPFKSKNSRASGSMYKIIPTKTRAVGISWRVNEKIDSVKIDVSPNTSDGIFLERLNQIQRDNHKMYLKDSLKYKDVGY